MKNVKNEIIVATILIILAAMTGIASANGQGGACPDRNSLSSHTELYDYLFADKIVDGNIVTYLLNTVDKDGASVIGYCVYPPTVSVNNDDLTALYVGNIGPWTIFHPDKDYFGFERGQGGNNNNIPIDGTTDVKVGKVDYEESGLPKNEVILFHINDREECGQDETCWRRSGTPPPLPVSEASTIVLMSAGLIGLFLAARKFRK